MDVRVILLKPQEDGNVGAIARVMRNFGFKELYIVDPICELGKDARRFASHGLTVLENAKVVDSFDDAIKGCDRIIGTTGKKGGHKTPKRKAITPEQLSESVSGKTALVFGNEAHGIPNTILERVDLVVRIPSNPEYPILNLSQAVCILMYELSKKKYEKTVKEKPLSRTMRAQLDKYTKEICDDVYEQDHQAKFVENTLQRVYGKAMLSEQDGRRLISFYRKITGKLD